MEASQMLQFTLFCIIKKVMEPCCMSLVISNSAGNKNISNLRCGRRKSALRLASLTEFKIITVSYYLNVFTECGCIIVLLL